MHGIPGFTFILATVLSQQTFSGFTLCGLLQIKQYLQANMLHDINAVDCQYFLSGEHAEYLFDQIFDIDIPNDFYSYLLAKSCGLSKALHFRSHI
jgi:hypothetical protein